MDDARTTVLEWAARFLETGDERGEGTLRLVVSGEHVWRFISGPTREVREESSHNLMAATDCTVTVSSADLVRWGRGELNPQAAFQGGRIRVSGDGAVALRMNRFFSSSKGTL